MNKLLSIFFIAIYFMGFLPSTWVLMDFYMNREDYTQKYCVNLDRGITQCRASCYLESLLKEERKSMQGSELVILKNVKSSEYCQDQKVLIKESKIILNSSPIFLQNNYYFDFSDFIFHPPKI